MKYRIAIVVSQFYHDIANQMQHQALLRAMELDIKPKIYNVPGAVELPIIAQKLAAKSFFDAIIVLGAVIRGETDHYDHVCNQVSYGCQKVALGYSVPVIFGVLTCETEAQIFERLGGRMGNKPKEMIDTAVAMIDLIRDIDGF